MNQERRHRLTHLFTVRLWIEPGARGSVEVRGRVQHILSGKTIYFRTWVDLVTFLETALVIARPPSAPDDDHSGAPGNG